MSLVKGVLEHSFLARRESFPTQGVVASVDTTTNTAVIDTGHRLPDGTSQYLYDVPFQGQSPPAVGWTATLAYGNSNPGSVYIAMTQLSGVAAANTQEINASNVVNTIRKTGETDGQSGDITLDPGTDITIIRAGKVFTIALNDCTLESGLFGMFTSVCDRLTEIEAALAALGYTPSGFEYSLDFSVPQNSFYRLMGWG